MGTLRGILLFFLYFTYISRISVKIKLVVYVIQYPVSHSGYIFQKLQQKTNINIHEILFYKYFASVLRWSHIIAPPTVAMCFVTSESQKNSQILSWFLTRLLNCYFQTYREGLSDFQKCSVKEKEILQTTKGAVLHGCVHRDVFTVSVCVYTRCLYFFVAVEGGHYCWGTYFGSSRINATRLSGWGLPISSPLCYKKFEEVINVIGPSLLSKVHLAVHVGLYVTPEYCMSVVNVLLKERWLTEAHLPSWGSICEFICLDY